MVDGLSFLTICGKMMVSRKKKMRSTEKSTKTATTAAETRRRRSFYYFVAENRQTYSTLHRNVHCDRYHLFKEANIDCDIA